MISLTSVSNVAKKIFGTANDRELKTIRPLVEKINSIESQFTSLTADQLKAKTGEFKERLSRGESLDSILPEAFATVRETSKRILGMRHFDVQMIGGTVLHRGKIAEMRTGEGKTLVGTLPSYLNALTGKGVHVVTVNDYLAKRDSEWMGQIHRYLGLSVGLIGHGLSDRDRKKNYGCDITYGTNNEFGFDYLRDNMKFRLEDYVQRELNFAIIDEVDSILIDEARTPLIISGPSEQSTDQYYEIDRQIRADGGLKKEEDYTVDEKSKTASLTEKGVEKMEKRLGIENLYDPIHIETLHHVNQSLRAHMLYKKDADYVIQDDKVIIVDEFTGRLMDGRRWSDGLHQAVEAKEGVRIESENQTLATITFQNLFRMYNKLSGMTGTADTEALEFDQIYKLKVVVIPTNRPMIRNDIEDEIYKTEDQKFKAIADEVKKVHEKGQPILIGTVTVDKSEKLSHMLKQEGVRHHVLNAKQHSREADIVAQAGKKGSVTIATNMAGRGTDILLGGNAEQITHMEMGKKPQDPEELKAWDQKFQETLGRHQKECKAERDEVMGAGGLYILGTERHESRRIDNQLRGRAGRQGDPGTSKFFLSLDDDLMRIFGGQSIKKFMDDDAVIQGRILSRSIENAQKKVEGHNYDIRKHLLKYDDVMNEQRKIIYALRKEVLSLDNLKPMVFSFTQEIVQEMADDFFPKGKLKRIDGIPTFLEKEFNEAMQMTFQSPKHFTENDIQPFDANGLKSSILEEAKKLYENKEKQYGEKIMREIEKMVLLTTIDSLWKDHLLAMDSLREGIGLQGYGQKDPLIEYKKQGFTFFEMMMKQIMGDSIRKLFAVQVSQTDHPYSGHDFSEQEFEYNVSESGDLESPSPRQSLLDQQMAKRAPQRQNMSHPSMSQGNGFDPLARPGAPSPHQVVADGSQGTFTREMEKVGRNDPCPCGSGKKYKKCHGE